jgi:large conductance mechanosensitive channel
MKEFRAFILRGNVVDLAVGVVIGVAFQAVVNSLVKDILTPLLGVFGTPDFRELVVSAGTATLSVGLFLNALISFLTVAAAIFFFVIKPLNHLMDRRKPTPPVAAAVRDCPQCLSSIPEGATRCAYCTGLVDPVSSA